MKSHWTRKLKALGACEEAITWAKAYPSFETAWQACQNPAHMLWLLPEIGAGQRDMVELACTFAESAEHHAEQYPAVAKCNATVRAWLSGVATLEDVAAARAAAWAAGDAAGAARAAARDAARDAQCDIIRKRFPSPTIEVVR